MSESTSTERIRLPEWVKVKLPGDGAYSEIRQRVKDLKLNTVCEEARCPNIAECWGGGTATFMVMGYVCTRGCRFCDVMSGKPKSLPDPEEPARVAEAAAQMKLKYVVVTSVDRDDLPDGGADHFAKTVAALQARVPEIVVEVLTPDFAGDEVAVRAMAKSGAQVLAHNLETTRPMTRVIRDARCDYDWSLKVLNIYRREMPKMVIKSSLMLGLGEEDKDVDQALIDLREAGVDWVTVGQYLQPSRKHAPVKRFVHPDQFKAWDARAREIGFPLVSAGPLVRSSYRAAEHDAVRIIRARQG